SARRGAGAASRVQDEPDASGGGVHRAMSTGSLLDLLHAAGPALARLASILLACSLAFPADSLFAQAPEIVRIGFAAPLTGPQAHYGKDSQNGAQLAIE